MAALTNYTGFEYGYAAPEIDVTSGTPAFFSTVTDPTKVHNGGYSLECGNGDYARIKCDPQTASPIEQYGAGGFYFYIDVGGLADTPFSIRTSAGGQVCAIGITSSRYLTIQDSAGTTQATDTTSQLTADTWYKIEYRFFRAPTSGYMHVYLNDSLLISATGIDLGTADYIYAQFEASAVTNDFHFDDWYHMSSISAIAASELLGFGQSKLWASGGAFWQPSNADSAVLSTSDAPAVGTLNNVGERPIADSNEMEWIGSADTYTFSTAYTYNTDTGTGARTIIAQKGWLRLDRDGGGGSSHFGSLGRYEGSDTFTVGESSDLLLATNPVDYFLFTTTSTRLVATSSHSPALGIRISGAQDLHLYECGVVTFSTDDEAPAVITGTGSFTLGAFTVAGTGEQGDLTAVGAFTLGAFTAAGTGEQLNEGIGAATLGDFTVAGTGQVIDTPVVGIGAFTLADFTTVGVGEQLNEGIGSLSIGDFTVTGTGEQLNEGIGSLSIADFTVAGTGEQGPLTAVGAFTIADFTSTGTGSVSWGPPIQGIGAFTLGDFTASGTGEQLNEGIGAVTISDFTVAGAGEQLLEGIGSFTIGDFTVAGVGNLTYTPIEGVGSFTLGDFTTTSTGEQLNEGVGSFTLGDFTTTGTGVVGDIVTGSGNFTLPAFTISATGEQILEGIGSFTLPEFTTTGTGEQLNEGAGSFTLSDFTVDATGQALAQGIGSLSFGEFALVGTAQALAQGTASITLEPITIVGTAQHVTEGAGAFTIGDFTISATAIAVTTIYGEVVLTLTKMGNTAITLQEIESVGLTLEQITGIDVSVILPN